MNSSILQYLTHFCYNDPHPPYTYKWDLRHSGHNLFAGVLLMLTYIEN